MRAPTPMARRPSANSTQTSTAPHGLRGHLKQLLPRHALFAVHLVIHDLSSVPLVHGDFGVRWRFKSVQSAAAAGGGGHRLLDRMRGGSRSAIPSPASSITNVTTAPSMRSASSVWKGKGRAVERMETPDELGVVRPGADGILINVVDTSPDEASSHDSGRGHDDEDDGDPSPYFAPGTAASVSMTSLHAHLPVLNGESSDDGRGSTPYLPLQDHAVSWEQTVDVVVQMSISRDTHDLLPNELKLLVQQVPFYHHSLICAIS